MCVVQKRGGSNVRVPMTFSFPPVNFMHQSGSCGNISYFRRDTRILLFEDSQKDQAQNILLSRAVHIFDPPNTYETPFI